MSASINDYKGLPSPKRRWKIRLRNIREYWERYGSSRRHERDRILDADPFDIDAARAFLEEHHASTAKLEWWEKAFGLALILAGFLVGRSCA